MRRFVLPAGKVTGEGKAGVADAHGRTPAPNASPIHSLLLVDFSLRLLNFAGIDLPIRTCSTTMLFETHQAPSPHAFDVDYDRFQADVIEASRQRPVLVDFWAEWCAPCRQLSPHLNRVVDEHAGGIALAKVEVDDGANMKLAGHYRLRGFPTVILFQHGEERGRFSGSRSSHQLREWIEQHLDKGSAEHRAA